MFAAQAPADHFSFWAILGSLLTIASSILLYFFGKVRLSPKVKLVDVEILNVPTVAHFVPFNLAAIDLTFRNDRQKTAVITEVEVEVKDIWTLVLQFPVMQALPVSATYDLVLNPTKATPYALKVPVSQQLKADEADRIRLTVGLDPLKPFENFYWISIRLVDDAGRKTNTIDFVLVLPDNSVSQAKPEYFLEDYEKKLEAHRKQTWSSPNIKATADLMFDPAAAREIHNHNRLSILKASLVSGYRNNRAVTLIDLFPKT